jgi:hypothetical protein
LAAIISSTSRPNVSWFRFEKMMAPQTFSEFSLPRHFRKSLSLSLDSTELFVHPDDDVPLCGSLRKFMKSVQRSE